MKEIKKEKIGELMKAARLHAEISQAEMARQLKSTRMVVREWEISDKTPSVVNFLRYMNICGKKIKID